jgi:hypothetical protein
MVEFAYNNIIHSSTQQKPFFANMACTPCLTSKERTRLWTLQLKIESCGWQTFKPNLFLALKKRKGDTKKMPMNIVRNNQVWLWWQNIKTTRPSTKLDYQRLGRFTIMKQINVVAFQLELLNSMKIHHVFHVSLLEPYHASTVPWRICEPPPPNEVNDEQAYEMLDVLDSRISNDQI